MVTTMWQQARCARRGVAQPTAAAHRAAATGPRITAPPGPVPRPWGACRRSAGSNKRRVAAGQPDRAPLPGSYIELGQDPVGLLVELSIEVIETRQEMRTYGTDEHPVTVHDEYNPVFLGQLAYVLDMAAQWYTGFQTDRPGQDPTVGGIRVFAARGALAPHEEERWAEFEQYLAAKGWDLQELIDLLRTLRGGSRILPYFYEEELNKVTVEHLRLWAGKLFQDNAQLQRALGLIELVREFGDVDKPLALLNLRIPDMKERVKQVVAAGLGQRPPAEPQARRT